MESHLFIPHFHPQITVSLIFYGLGGTLSWIVCSFPTYDVFHTSRKLILFLTISFAFDASTQWSRMIKVGRAAEFYTTVRFCFSIYRFSCCWTFLHYWMNRSQRRVCQYRTGFNPLAFWLSPSPSVNSFPTKVVQSWRWSLFSVAKIHWVGHTCRTLVKYVPQWFPAELLLFWLSCIALLKISWSSRT